MVGPRPYQPLPLRSPWPLPILLTALGTVLPKSLMEAFSSNSHLNVHEVQAESSPYFTALQNENNLETQRCPVKQRLISGISIFQKNLWSGLKIIR